MLNKKKGRKEGWREEKRKKGRKKRGEREGEDGEEERRKKRKEENEKRVCVNRSKDEIAGNVRHSLVCSHYLYFTIMSTAK